MYAVVLREHGGPEKLRYERVLDPQPGPGEVVIDLDASSINHLDLKVRRGSSGFPVKLPLIPGSEGAGRITAIGDCVTGWREGQRVLVLPWQRCGKCEWCRKGVDNQCLNATFLGISVAGCYAQRIATRATSLLPLPESVSARDAAAIPVAMGTAWHALITIAQVREGETVLVMAATSGVGVALVQLAMRVGARVIGTARDERKLARLKELGADEAVSYARADWVDEVRRLTGGRGVDLVMEQVGGETLQLALRCLTRRGRLVSFGASGGLRITIDDWQYVYRNELRIYGAGASSNEEVRNVLECVKDGKLRPVVEEVFPLEEADRAHRFMEDRKHFGKVILEP